MKMSKTSLAALCAACSLAVATPAQEWTRLRGPKGQGHGANELPAVLTESNVQWRVDAGTGHSSPVLWGASLFLTRLGEQGGSREVVCFDADTGEERWARTFEFEAHDQHQLNSFTSSTPTVDADAVYDQADAGGFIKLWGLPSGIAHRVRHGMAGSSPGGPPTEAETDGLHDASEGDEGVTALGDEIAGMPLTPK